MSNTAVENEVEVEADAESNAGTEATETVIRDGEDVTPKAVKLTPKRELGFVGADLPDNEKAPRKPREGGGGAGRDKNMFVELLQPIVADADLHGAWLVASEYYTPTGAAGAKKAILAGERLLPVGLWEFESRRFNFVVEDAEVQGKNIKTDPETGVRSIPSSRLYVRYFGSDVAKPEGDEGANFVEGTGPEVKAEAEAEADTAE